MTSGDGTAAKPACAWVRANVLTAEVRKRIDADRLVTETFEFDKIAMVANERERFLDFVARRLLNL